MDAFINQILTSLEEDSRIEEFRLYISETERVALGLRDSCLGGIHTPPQKTKSRDGYGVLRFGDGKVGKVEINTLAGEHLPDLLESSYLGRYESEDEVCHLKAQKSPSIPLYDERVEKVLSGDLSPLVNLSIHLLGRAIFRQVEMVNGTTSASRTNKRVLSSGGLDLSQKSSYFHASFGLDGLIYDWESHRQWWNMERFDARLERGLEWRDLLGLEPEKPAADVYPVIIHPRLVKSLVRHYLFSNLYASSLWMGNSAFSLEDFKEKKQIFRKDLFMGTDPARPYHAGSQLFSSDGIPSRREMFIVDGRLTRPIASRKYARRTGFDLTYPPSTNSLVLGGRAPIPYFEIQKSLDRGYLLSSVLGLHTQDRASGHFSLRSPNALLIEKGRPTGKVSTLIDGNFFEFLSREDFEFVQFPQEDVPGIFINCRCS